MAALTNAAPRTPVPLRLTATDIAAAVEGRLESGAADQVVEGFSIDTRTLTRGDLFFAIHGAHFDGHDFVPVALSRGASGVVIDARSAFVPATEPGHPAPIVLVVDDTVGALQKLARQVRRRSGAHVIAITGSAGKTTTKEITAEFLARRYRVFRNRGNLNNHIGLPLSLLDLRDRPEIAVVELGMNHPGEIRTLVGIAEPESRIWTNVSEAHAEFFASIDAIADAKAEILDGAAPDSLLIANANDSRVMTRARRFAGRVMTFGIEVQADVAAWHVRDLGLDGTESLFRTPAGERTLRVPLVGRGNLANVLAGMTAALRFQVSLSEIAATIGGLEPAPHRGQILRLRRGVTVLDDSYNSNPAALGRALDVVRSETGLTRRVAVIGEMLELGARSVQMHTASGRETASAGLDLLLTVGGAPVRALSAAAIDAGMPAASVLHFATSEEAADAASTLVRPGDLVLVKGSRGIRTDRVVERLQAEFA